MGSEFECLVFKPRPKLVLKHIFDLTLQQEEEENEIKGHHLVRDVKKSFDDYYMGLYVDNFASHVNENLSMVDVQNNYFQRNLNAQQKEEKSSLVSKFDSIPLRSYAFVSFPLSLRLSS